METITHTNDPMEVYNETTYKFEQIIEPNCDGTTDDVDTNNPNHTNNPIDTNYNDSTADVDTNNPIDTYYNDEPGELIDEVNGNYTNDIIHNSSASSYNNYHNYYPIEKGIKLNNWYVKKEIGSGGCAVVATVVSKRRNRLCAAKIFGLDSKTDFDKEVFVMRKLCHSKHPWFLAAYEYNHVLRYTEDEVFSYPMIVMEYYPGLTLYDVQFLTKNDPRYGKMDPINILRQVVQGIDYMHSRGLIHGDIKSTNVLIDVGIERIKLIDFTHSCTISYAQNHQEATVGTFGFTAPEILLSDYLTEKVDVWAIGTLLYELITYTPLFNVNKARGYPSNESSVYSNTKSYSDLLECYIHLVEIESLFGNYKNETGIISDSTSHNADKLLNHGRLIGFHTKGYKFTQMLNQLTTGLVTNPFYNGYDTQHLTQPLIDFYLSCMQLDPNDRLSTENLLYHQLLAPKKKKKGGRNKKRRRQ